MLKSLKQLLKSSPTVPVHDQAVPAQKASSAGPLGLKDAALSGWYQTETNELFRGVTISPEDVVVDVGCGNAGSAHFCGLRGPQMLLVDIDPAKVDAAVKRLQKTAARDVQGFVSDCNPIPIADATATRVISTEVIEHVDDPAQFLSELVRIGKPGALYVISVPDATSERLQEGFAPQEYYEKPNHIRVISREEFAEMVRASGLEIVEHTWYSFFWSIWFLFFWECKVDLSEPNHPLLDSWTRTWKLLLDMPRGPEIKERLDDLVAKSQVIIARKPA